MNGKIEELERTLELATIADEVILDIEVIDLGAIVLVRDLETEDEWEYHIVDIVQADPINDRISIQSPVGQALLGKRAGEIVEVIIPAGIANYHLVSIRWSNQ